MRRHRLDAQLETRLDNETYEELVEHRCFPRGLREQLPYEWSESPKILGVLFGEKLSYARHVEVLVGKAGVRHGVLSRLTRSNWGLETNILRVANEALLTSLTRYCLAMIGSGLYEDDFRTLETRHTHIGARRVGGLGMSARIETLIMVANTKSARNLFFLQCANKLDKCLRAFGSSILDSVNEWLSEIFCVTNFTITGCSVLLE